MNCSRGNSSWYRLHQAALSKRKQQFIARDWWRGCWARRTRSSYPVQVPLAQRVAVGGIRKDLVLRIGSFFYPGCAADSSILAATLQPEYVSGHDCSPLCKNIGRSPGRESSLCGGKLSQRRSAIHRVPVCSLAIRAGLWLPPNPHSERRLRQWHVSKMSARMTKELE